jgi:anti-sigma regulatory factor (Ser/Thr protein kinase)
MCDQTRARSPGGPFAHDGRDANSPDEDEAEAGMITRQSKTSRSLVDREAETPQALVPDVAEPVRDELSVLIPRDTATDGALERDPDGEWIGRLRRLGAARLRACALDELADEAQLLTSELLTNALRYGGDAEIGFRFVITSNTLLIAVTDGSPSRPRLTTVDSDSESGRGLLLVATLAAGWGTSPDGTTTWCTLTLPAAVRAASQHEQPAPWSTPGTWTLTTTQGTVTTGYLPDWAEDDPSETDVAPELLPARLAAINHRTVFEGQYMSVRAPDATGKAEEEEIFGASIDCNPYDENPAHRVPIANLQVLPDFWISALSPADLTAIIGQLRSQADRLETEVHPALTAAREDWINHLAETAICVHAPAQEQQPQRETRVTG